jgi:hypothetical protein
MDRNSIN